MRIIGGSAAGLLLKAPGGYEVRPTPDLVRQAIFNSLGERVVNARVLDLFSGTGALGLECLSRGAARVVCVEKSNKHARFIRHNLERTALPAARFELRIQDVSTAIGQLLANDARSFELIMADPPFGEKNVGRRSTSDSQNLLDDSRLPQLLAPEALFVLGHSKRDTLTFGSPWHEFKTLKHGDSIVEFLKARA